MNLLELRAAHPQMFYPQTWYNHELFARVDFTPSAPLIPPRDIVGVSRGLEPSTDKHLSTAILLAHHFIHDPHNPIWEYYLWCADTDARGQRVYVGGVSHENGRRFEIHRHLTITNQWGIPTWK